MHVPDVPPASPTIGLPVAAGRDLGETERRLLAELLSGRGVVRIRGCRGDRGPDALPSLLDLLDQDGARG